MLFALVPLASGIFDDAENITMQLERQLVYNVKWFDFIHGFMENF